MDFDFGGNELQDIGAFVAALIALALVLQTAVGNTVMFLAEAAKSAFNYPSGKGGLIATGIGMALGLFLGLATAVVSDADSDGFLALCLIGLFAGLFMGAGAVQNHKASGSVNTSVAAAVDVAKREHDNEFVNGYVEGYQEGENLSEVRKAVNEAAMFIGGQPVPEDFPRTLQYQEALRNPPTVQRFVNPVTAPAESGGMWGPDEDENLDEIIFGTSPADYEGGCDCTPNDPPSGEQEPEPEITKRRAINTTSNMA